MATIILDIDTISGESEMDDYTDKIEAIGIHDLVVGGFGTARTKLSEVVLTRYRDRASPKLADACSRGSDLGSVDIHLFKTVGTSSEIFLTYELTETYVSRIEFDTVDASAAAFLRHHGKANEGAADFRGDLLATTTVNTHDREYSRGRTKPNPAYGALPSHFTDTEVERLWLNAKIVKWIYTPYNSAGVQQGGSLGQLEQFLRKI